MGCELVKRAGKLAAKSKCSHTYAIATTTGSQKIFERLGYQTILELKYSDYEKDLNIYDNEPLLLYNTYLQRIFKMRKDFPCSCVLRYDKAPILPTEFECNYNNISINFRKRIIGAPSIEFGKYIMKYLN